MGDDKFVLARRKPTLPSHRHAHAAHPGTRLCDGISRREMLRAGGLGLLGLRLGDLLATKVQRPRRIEANGRQGQVVHRPVPDGRAAAAFDLGPQARRAGRSPRRDRADRHERARHAVRRADAASWPAWPTSWRPAGRFDRRQRPLVERLLHADRPAARADEFRERQPRPAERLAEHRLGRRPAHAAAAASCRATVRLPHHIFNTDGSVWPGQTPASSAARPIRGCSAASRRRPISSIPEFSLPVDVPAERLTRAAVAARASFNQRFAAVERQRPARPLRRPHAAGLRPALVAAGPRRRSTWPPSRRHARALRPDAVRPELPARAAADRGGRAAGAGELVSRPRRALGQSLLGFAHQRNAAAQGSARAADGQAFSALLEDLARARPARRDAGRLHVGIRPHAAVQRRGPAATTGAASSRSPWPAAAFAAAWSTARPTRSARYPQDGLVKPEDITATIFHCLGISPDTEIHDSLGRPFAVSRGQVLHQILS